MNTLIYQTNISVLPQDAKVFGEASVWVETKSTNNNNYVGFKFTIISGKEVTISADSNILCTSTDSTLVSSLTVTGGPKIIFVKSDHNRVNIKISDAYYIDKIDFGAVGATDPDNKTLGFGYFSFYTDMLDLCACREIYAPYGYSGKEPEAKEPMDCEDFQFFENLDDITWGTGSKIKGAIELYGNKRISNANFNIWNVSKETLNRSFGNIYMRGLVKDNENWSFKTSCPNLRLSAFLIEGLTTYSALTELITYLGEHPEYISVSSVTHQINDVISADITRLTPAFNAIATRLSTLSDKYKLKINGTTWTIQ